MRRSSDYFEADESLDESYDQQFDASIDDLDSYMEKLYELDIREKKNGTFMIMQLARTPENLEMLISNEPLLGALSRVLKDDGKNSMDLVINILYVFYSFSHFSQFHQVIMTYNVGSIVLKTVEYEEQRYQELQRKLREPNSTPSDVKKINAMFHKQEKLLYVCFHILLNLAEDVNVELKMKKRNIIPCLIKTFNRQNEDLLILVVTFLKKLSIFQENKNEMVECGIVEDLKNLVNHKNETLLNATLRLLLNLSFDVKVREQLVQIMPLLIALLREPLHMEIVIKLLYHLSMDEKCRSVFYFHESKPLNDIMRLIIHYPEPCIEKHLMALAINLSINAKNAEMMVSVENALQQLIARMASSAQDSLLAKLIRNLSSHQKLKPFFRGLVPELVSFMTKASSPEYLVEVLGIIGNLVFEDISFHHFFQKYDLIKFFHQHMVHGFSEDDIVLEIIIVLGTMVNDEKTAEIVAKSVSLIRALCELFIDKQDDDEIMLQLLYTMYKLLTFESTRAIFLSQHQIIYSIVDLLHDNNQAIQGMSDRILDLVMDCDEKWREQLRKRKFEVYNEKWLDFIHDESQDQHEYVREGYDNHYLTGNIEDDELSVYFYSDLH